MKWCLKNRHVEILLVTLKMKNPGVLKMKNPGVPPRVGLIKVSAASSSSTLSSHLSSPGPLIVLIVALMIITLLLTGLYCFWRSRSRDKSAGNLVEFKSFSDLKKDGRLKENLCDLTADVNKLYEEFREMEEEAKEEAHTKVTETATEDQNKTHNRYVDIGRYSKPFVNQSQT